MVLGSGTPASGARRPQTASVTLPGPRPLVAATGGDGKATSRGSVTCVEDHSQ